MEWLDYLGISENYRQKMIKLNNRWAKVDAYFPETKTICEFYGDY